MKHLIPALACFAALTTQGLISAAESPDIKAIQKSLKNVPALELPAKASQMVVLADRTQKEAVAVAVVQAAIQRNPASAPAVVTAILKQTPSVAPAVLAASGHSQIKPANVGKSTSIAQDAPRLGAPDRDQPPNPRGTGSGKGHGDGAGHGKGHAYGHLKHYASP